MHVAVISGGDWQQMVSRLPTGADLWRLWLMPTTGTKLYINENEGWHPLYGEMLCEEKMAIIEVRCNRVRTSRSGCERVEKRGSQTTFSARGQQAPIQEKEKGEPNFAKRKAIRTDVRVRLPGLSINLGGATSIDITREGGDKAHGLKKLRDTIGITLDAMMYIGDAISRAENDFRAKELGLDTVSVCDPRETLKAIEAMIAFRG